MLLLYKFTGENKGSVNSWDVKVVWKIKFFVFGSTSLCYPNTFILTAYLVFWTYVIFLFTLWSIYLFTLWMGMFCQLARLLVPNRMGTWTRGIYILPVLKAESPRPRCRQGGLPLRAVVAGSASGLSLGLAGSSSGGFFLTGAFVCASVSSVSLLL